MAHCDFLFDSSRRLLHSLALHGKRRRFLLLAWWITITGCGVEVVKPQPNRHRKSADEPRSSRSSVTSLAANAKEVTHPPDTSHATSIDRQRQQTDSTMTPAARRTGTPKLVADETTYDFGTMNPVTNQRHSFLVRNEGTDDLRFLDRRSSCDCTVGHFPKEPIPPGGSAEIIVQWHTSASQRLFRQSATVETNDPACPSLTFTISGKVRVHMGAEPAELVAADVRPDETRTLTTIVSSQVWSDMAIKHVETSLPELKWQVNAASADQLAAHEAVAGYSLEVTLPGNLPVGPFRHWVRLHIQHTDQSSDQNSATEVYEIPLHGKVLRRLAVYGPGIDMTGTVDLGVVSSSAGLTRRLILKVYDADHHLTLKQAKCDPDFLQVQIVPATPTQVDRGIYYLELTVPAGSPDCRYLRARPGQLLLEFDHPRIEPLELKVVLSVARDDANSRSTRSSASNGSLHLTRLVDSHERARSK